MFLKSSENSEGLFTSSVSTTVARGLVGKEDLAKCTLEMPGFDIHMKKEVPLIEEESKFKISLLHHDIPLPQFLRRS